MSPHLRFSANICGSTILKVQCETGKPLIDADCFDEHVETFMSPHLRFSANICGSTILKVQCETGKPQIDADCFDEHVETFMSPHLRFSANICGSRILQISAEKNSILANIVFRNSVPNNRNEFLREQTGNSIVFSVPRAFIELRLALNENRLAI